MCQGRKRQSIKVVPVNQYVDTESTATDEPPTTPKHDNIHRKLAPMITPPLSFDDVTMSTGHQEEKSIRKVKFVQHDDNRICETIIDSSFKPSSRMTTQEKKDRWWQAEETLMFFHAANVVSNEIKKRENTYEKDNVDSYASVLERVYAASIQFANDNMDNADADRFFFLNENDFSLLERWAEKGHCRRGLERWSCSGLSKERLKRKFITVQAVLHVQKLLSIRSDVSVDEKAGALRAASEQSSRPARLFALAMGKADAVVSKGAPLPLPTSLQVNFRNPAHKLFIGDNECCQASKVVCATPTHDRGADTHFSFSEADSMVSEGASSTFPRLKVNFDNPRHKMFVTNNQYHQATKVVCATPTHDRVPDTHFVF